ncbi:hypothetical protein, partial [Escherichia coli]|uniref:hypothetical protein n=1 Tax=Escherichia coli TaxID=562 RepID=UPI0010CB40B0
QKTSPSVKTNTTINQNNMAVYFSSVNKKVQIFSPQKNHQHGIELLFTIHTSFCLFMLIG